MKIKLTLQEIKYLISSGLLNDGVDSFELNISSTSASEIRDSLGEYLQLYGFDSQYNLNSQGLIINELVDKFYE